MQIRHATPLAAKVAAKNHLNSLFMEAQAKLIPALAPFVGQKIHLATGGFAAKFKKAIDPLLDFKGPGIQYAYLRTSIYSLMLEAKVCHSSPGRNCDHGVYMDGSIYIGEIDGLILTKIHPPVTLGTDYNEQEIVQARKNITAAREELRRWEGAIVGFGEWDN